MRHYHHHHHHTRVPLADVQTPWLLVQSRIPTRLEKPPWNVISRQATPERACRYPGTKGEPPHATPHRDKSVIDHLALFGGRLAIRSTAPSAALVKTIKWDVHAPSALVVFLMATSTSVSWSPRVYNRVADLYPPLPPPCWPVPCTQRRPSTSSTAASPRCFARNMWWPLQIEHPALRNDSPGAGHSPPFPPGPRTTKLQHPGATILDHRDDLLCLIKETVMGGVVDWPFSLFGSDSSSTLVYGDYCLPYGEQESCSCYLHSEPPHVCRVHTDELLESPSDDPTPEHCEHGENDSTVAGKPKFDLQFLRDFNWRSPSVLVSLAVLAVFVLGLVFISAITGTVNAGKMEKLEVLPDLVEKGEAKLEEPEYVPSASSEKQAAQTTMRVLRRFNAKKHKAAKRRLITTAPKPRAVARGRNVPSTSRWPGTKAVRRTPRWTRVPPNTSRRRRKPPSTRATPTIKREAKRTTVRGLRGSEAKREKAAKRRLATTAPKPRMRTHGRTVPSTSGWRRAKLVSRTTKRTWERPEISGSSRQPRRARGADTTERTDGAKRREPVHPRSRNLPDLNAPVVRPRRTPPQTLVGGEMARETTLALQRPMIATGKGEKSGGAIGGWHENSSRFGGGDHSGETKRGLETMGGRFVGATKNHVEAVTRSHAVDSSIDEDDEGVAADMSEENER
ncbi:uncharacterized protein LOC144158869 [Haemaphysalis longicornis]